RESFGFLVALFDDLSERWSKPLLDRFRQRDGGFLYVAQERNIGRINFADAVAIQGGVNHFPLPWHGRLISLLIGHAPAEVQECVDIFWMTDVETAGDVAHVERVGRGKII